MGRGNQPAREDGDVVALLVNDARNLFNDDRNHQAAAGFVGLGQSAARGQAVVEDCGLEVRVFARETKLAFHQHCDPAVF